MKNVLNHALCYLGLAAAVVVLLGIDTLLTYQFSSWHAYEQVSAWEAAVAIGLVVAFNLVGLLLSFFDWLDRLRFRLGRRWQELGSRREN